MSKYRKRLPQSHERMFMTDGGLETTLIYHHGIDLPAFAAFDLLKNEAGINQLRRYYSHYTELARSHGIGLVLESPTWRANPDWGTKLGYDVVMLTDANRKAIDLMHELRAASERAQSKMVVSGNLGPRGDGYVSGLRMSASGARDYHSPQIETFAQTEADMICALTMNYVEEAIGIGQAAKACAMPVALSFTLETDGRLPSGDTLADAIERTDRETGRYPVYYMINCAHPSHFADMLNQGGAWVERIGGVRANASRRSHADLDQSTDLDAGDSQELAQQYRELSRRLPKLAVVGGCCGTDHRHVDAMCRALGMSGRKAQFDS